MRRVAIVGTGQTKYVTKRFDAAAPDLVYEATSLALADAAIDPEDVQAVVFSLGPEALHGINSLEKWCVDAAACRNKPVLRVNTGGASGGSAANEATHLVASGLFDVVVAVGLERVGESDDAQLILNKIFDPLVSQAIPLNIIVTNAMRAVRNMERYGYSEFHMAKISAKNHANALNNPYAHVRSAVTIEDVLKSPIQCWPLKRLDCCPRSDGACAVVFASETIAKASERKPAWVVGLAGVATVTTPGESFPGAECDVMNLREVTAVRKAYKMAGIDDPRRQVDVVEPYQPFSYMEIDSYHCLGFCEEGEATRLVEEGFGEMSGEVPFSPSGGPLCSNPIGATALVRVAEAACQVVGKAGLRQVPDARIALATGAGGSPGPGSASFYTAMVLSAHSPVS